MDLTSFRRFFAVEATADHWAHRSFSADHPARSPTTQREQKPSSGDSTDPQLARGRVSIYYFNYQRETTIRRQKLAAACTHYRSSAPAARGLRAYVRISCRNHGLPKLPLVCAYVRMCVCPQLVKSFFLGNGRRNFSPTPLENNRKRSPRFVSRCAIVCRPRSVVSAVPLEPAYVTSLFSPLSDGAPARLTGAVGRAEGEDDRGVR